MPRETPASTSRLRALGAVETAMAVLHEQRGTTQTTSLVQVRGKLDAALLVTAAAQLQARHPLLQAVIGEQDGALYFMQPANLPVIAVRHMVQEQAGQWRTELEYELNQPLDPARALWKLALIEETETGSGTVMLTCHHALVDAVSLVALLAECLQLADAMQAGQALPAERQPLARPLDAYLRPLAVTSAPAPATSAPAPATSTPAPILPGPAYLQAVALEQRHTALWYDQFDAAQIEQMQQSARQVGVNLNAWLAAGLLLAAQQVGLGEQLRINSAVSLRQRTEPAIGNEVLGCYIRVAPSELVLAGRTMAEVAREYHAKLAAQLALADAAMPTPDLAQLRANATRLIEGSTFAQGIAMTNHGRLHFPAYRHFTVQRYLNVAHRVAGNFAVALHITTFEQQLSLAFTHVWPLISLDSIIRLQTAMRNLLLTRPTHHESHEFHESRGLQEKQEKQESPL